MDGHVPYIWEVINAYKLLVREHEENRPLWRFICRLECDIKLHFKK